jgi:hypothetical protein
LGANDWAPTMDESDAFDREVDNAKEAGGDFVYGV